MSHLLMCPPDYFGIEYEINPWMRLSNQSNPDRARAQWRVSEYQAAWRPSRASSGPSGAASTQPRTTSWRTPRPPAIVATTVE